MNQHGRERKESGEQAQQIILLCEPQMLTTLAEDLVNKLANSNYEAVVLMRGNTSKRHDGVLLIEAAQSIPLDVLKDLRVHDFVVYDMPGSDSDERIPKQIVEPDYQAAPDLLSPPPIPEGYSPRAKPRPLSTDDCYWIVRAQKLGEGEGWLLYDGGGFCREFLTIEESVTLLYTFLEQTDSDLLSRLTPHYLAVHAPGVALVRAYLRAMQREVTGRVKLHQLSRQSIDQEQPHSTEEKPKGEPRP